jgi:hypothetical protein
MSQPEMRMANQAEVAAIETMATPFVDALQTLPVQEAMKLWCYITARLVLDLEPKPGFTRISGFDQWAASARTTIERNEQLHRESLS